MSDLKNQKCSQMNLFLFLHLNLDLYLYMRHLSVVANFFFVEIFP